MNTADDERMPPHDRGAEQCALGGMLLASEALADVTEILEPDDHFVPAHQVIHEAILRLRDREEPVDAVTVANELTRRGELVKVGGGVYLHTLIASVPTPASAGYYAGIVREYAVARRMGDAGETIKQIGYEAGMDAADRAEQAYRILDEATGKAVPPKARSLADLLVPALDRIEQGPDVASGMTTGWSDLDELLLGFQSGEVVIFAGRPGMGKTTAMLNAAAHAALRLGLPGLICSLEMSEQECIESILAAEAGVDLRCLRSAKLTDADWGRIAKAAGTLSECPILINTDPHLTLQGIRSDLRTMRRTGNPAAFVVVDYLQLMTSGGKTESRQAEVSELSRGIKVLAKEFGIPAIVGSQLNRGPEMRSDHKPLMADLRESGSVEQDASVVILLFREDEYEPESPRAGEIDFIVAKNRRGPKATVTLAFQGHYARCVDMYKPWTASAAAGEEAA